MSNNIKQLLYGSWGLLGFYRGTQYYDFTNEEKMKKYLKDPTYNKKPQDFYTNKIGVGLMGIVCYMLPFFFVFPAIKEIHRLEINLRGLEEEKKKPEYYELF